MKTVAKKAGLLSFGLLMSLVLVGCGQQNTSRQQNEINTYNPTLEEQKSFEDHAEEEHGEGHEYINNEQLAAFDASDLTEQETADIIHMRQEEKMARDVYKTLGETYPINQFKNIPLSEQKHTDAMELLLERYGITDPIVDETRIGVYEDERFTTLFSELTTTGKKSLVDALSVGATIEDINIAQLLYVIDNTDNLDIMFVYRSVLEQSHNHMRSFINALQKEGVTYTPEHITQDYFDSII